MIPFTAFSSYQVFIYLLNQHRILVPDIMLPKVPDELTPSSTTDILTIDSDSIASSFNLYEASSTEVQPDLSHLDGNLNSHVSITQIRCSID